VSGSRPRSTPSCLLDHEPKDVCLVAVPFSERPAFPHPDYSTLFAGLPGTGDSQRRPAELASDLPYAEGAFPVAGFLQVRDESGVAWVCLAVVGLLR
jgi:hypothetical protein